MNLHDLVRDPAALVDRLNAKAGQVVGTFSWNAERERFVLRARPAHSSYSCIHQARYYLDGGYLWYRCRVHGDLVLDNDAWHCDATIPEEYYR